jgi:hypothetical protein
VSARFYVCDADGCNTGDRPMTYLRACGSHELLATCTSERAAAIIEQANARSTAMLAVLEQIARMETESEYEDRTGDGMSGDDAVQTLSDLIHMARAAAAQARGEVQS